MEFRETLLAAQRNQQQKSSGNLYYKSRFDPPKKEQKQRDRLSANIQKFLVKKEEEEKQKKLEALKKRDELQALRDPKALRKIQKSLKVIKSANKSVLEDALDRDNTAITLEGIDLPDQDDYGYESQEAAAIYEKMMLKYSKIPDEPKFPVGNHTVKKDLNGTRERVKHALQHEDEPVPHKRRRRGENGERDLSPPTRYEPEKKADSKPKFKKPAPPPMDFNQLLKLAEQKKCEPIDSMQKKTATEADTKERLMTKKQKREYEEEMARRQRRQERIDAEKAGGRRVQKEEKPTEKSKKPESNNPSGFGRIPKLGDKNRNNSPKPSVDKDRMERIRMEKQREKERVKVEKDKPEFDKGKMDRERLDKLKAERERIDRDIERLNKDRERLDKTKTMLESSRSDKTMKPGDKSVDRTKLNSRDNVKQDVKKNIDLKSQNTYRIDKNSNEKKTMPSKSNDSKYMNGHSSQGKPVPKHNKEQGIQKNGARDKVMMNREGNRDGLPRMENGKKVLGPQKGVPPKRPDDRQLPPGVKGQGQGQPGPSKPKLANSFDFDKHVNGLKKNGNDRNGVRPSDGKRRPHPDDLRKKPKRRLDSESDYDSEMDDFIDDGDENMDYSTHIKEIFGYDKSKYRDMDDDDDPDMESSFARQQREEYISKKIGIMEDLEDMRMEAMEKKKSKKVRRISDD